MTRAERAPNRLANLRDVATSLPDGRIRAGVLLRSDAPQPGDLEPDWVSWPPSTVIDLRVRGEQPGAHPLVGVAIVHTAPLFDDQHALQHTASGARADAVTIYLKLVAATLGPRLAPVIELIAQSDGATLVHCAAGKDRTGVAVALALRLCDIPRDEVIADFLRTDEAVVGIARRLRAAGVDVPNGDSPAWRSPRAAIEAVLDTWDDHQAGTSGWYLDHGGNESVLRLLRSRLLGPQ